MADAPRISHGSNVPGDFYVEDGCCLSCEIPKSVAPELFAFAGDGSCYVCKQPASEQQLGQMIEAFEVQEVDCIRYKGANRVIQIQLIDAGEGGQCDGLDPELKIRHRAVQALREAERSAARASARVEARKVWIRKVFGWFRRDS